MQAQKKEQKEIQRRITINANKNSCSNAKVTRVSVKCNDRYFFGETPTIKISITNTSSSIKIVKEAEHQKFNIELTGLFDEDDIEQQNKKSFYDGSWDIPKETKPPLSGEWRIFQEPRKREPRFVKLAPGESTNLELNLAKIFSSELLNVSKYKLTIKSEAGDKVVREFEVYFDEQKSAAFLSAFIRSGEALDQMLADEKHSYLRRTFSTGESSRIWALYRFAKFDKKGLVVLLEELAKSGNEDQCSFASNVLNRIKAGKPLT
ncbi:MAG: hypothetical protein ACKVQW_10735 [Pyrinomonadaceae bacterium]